MADMIAFPDRPTPTGPEPLWRHLLGDQLRRRRHEREETLTETADTAEIVDEPAAVRRGIRRCPQRSTS